MKPAAVRIAVLLLLGYFLASSPSAAFDSGTRGLSLSAEEQQWLKTHDTIRVRISSHYPPFVFMENGQARGMGYDYLKAVFDRLGLRMVPTRPMTWSEAQKNLQAGQGIDLQPVMVRSAERSNHIVFTKDYLSFPLVIFARRYAGFVGGLQDLTGKSVAMEKGYLYRRWLSRDFPKIQIIEVATSEEALKAVATGRADAYLGNLAVGTFLAERLGFANIQVSAPSPYGQALLAMGVRKDWPELASLIDKALQAMTPDEHRAIRNKWLTMRYEYGISPSQVLKWGFWSGGAVLVIFLLVLAWNRKLQREVENRLKAEAALRENEERFRQLTENVEEVFWIISPDWKRVLYISPAYEKTWGQSCQRLYQDPESWFKSIVDEDRKAVADYLQEIITGDPAEIVFPEYRVRRPDGSIRWILGRGFPVYGDNGEVVRIVGVSQDISLLKKSQQQQREYLSLLENLDRLDNVIRRADDMERMMRDVLDGLLEIFGSDRAWLLYPCDPEALSVQIPMERTRPEYPGAGKSQISFNQQSGLAEACRLCLEADRPLAFNAGNNQAWTSEEYAREFSIVSQLALALHPKTGPPWMLGMHQCSHDRIWTDQEQQLFQEAGRRIADALSSLIFLNNLRESEANYRQLYQSTKRSEDLYRGLLHSSADAIIQYDMAGNVLYVSPAFTRLFGWTPEEVVGKPLDFVPETEREASMKIVVDLIQTGTPCSGFESRRLTKSGEVLTVSISGSRYHDHEGRPAGMLSIIRDITGTKQLESKFQQSQRLEAIGTLAGGIAHDFNNLLMGIQGRCSLMMAGADPNGENFDHLKGIEEYVRSAADLTRQLLGFARGGRYEVQTTDLNELIKAQNRMFGRTRKEITIRGKYDKELWPVEVDRGQIRQVLLNFYVNAWHAMPGGGNILVTTENVFLNDLDGRQHNAPSGHYAKICITDTGVGMDPQTQQRIFEPFFTTKEMGRGTGLGLASAYGIIKNHGGFITVYSEMGAGSTFSLYLPATDKALIEESVQKGHITRGRGRVLLVDDEEMIVDVGGQMLATLGYDVVTAASGEEALDVYHSQGAEIDLVILDMIMPGIGGGETFDRLKEINPAVRVLLSSGYSVNGKASDILQRGCMGFIQKPFNLEQLSEKIHQAMTEPVA